MRHFFIACLLLHLLYSISCTNHSLTTSSQNAPLEYTEKQKGAHVFGRLDSSGIASIEQYNFDWVTLVPWGSMQDYDSKELSRRRRNRDSSRVKRYHEGWLSQVDALHNAGYKVFVKPHIWIRDPSGGKWRSDIYPTSDENWEAWKKSYREYIFQWARLAEQGEAEMFCVGTELTRLTLEKTEFWVELIAELREVFSGELTYAANWYEEYENVSFWDQLDYIGVQAYFPLTKSDSPTTEQIIAGWQPHLKSLSEVQQKFSKPILFTELGYKSTPDSAKQPWNWLDYEDEMTIPVAEETQANCYEAFFETVWPQPWFSGVHLWQLRSDFEKGRGRSDWDFTPQGKLATEVISRNFVKQISSP